MAPDPFPEPCPDDPDGQHHVGCGCDDETEGEFTPLERARAQGWTDEGLDRLARAVFPERTPAPGGHQRRGRWFGRLLVTTCTQPDGAPVLDGGCVVADGSSHGGYVLRLRRGPDAPALVLAWRDASVPWSMRTRIRVWRFRVERALLWRMVEGSLWVGRCRHAPRCAACSLPLTGFGIYGGEDAPELCRWCAPQTPVDFAGPEIRTAQDESLRLYPEQ